MKYLKSFNESVDYSIVENKPGYIQYNFEIENYHFECGFNMRISMDDGDLWVRNYKTVEKNNKILNLNPFKILSTLANITKDFLIKINPALLHIEHINTKEEDDYYMGKSLNKRANANYRYLKNIIPDDYTIEYYGVGNTVCYIKKKGFEYNVYDPKYKIGLNESTYTQIKHFEQFNTDMLSKVEVDKNFNLISGDTKFIFKLGDANAVVIDYGEPMGVEGIPNWAKKEHYIENLWRNKENEKSKGFGLLIILKILKNAKENGADIVTGKMREDRGIRLHEYYKSLGFEDIGDEEPDGVYIDLRTNKPIEYIQKLINDKNKITESTFTHLGEYTFEEDSVGYHHGQSDLVMYMKKGKETLAKANYSLYNGKIYIQFIESFVKGKGYGQEIMKQLAKIYGYENLERTSLTEDGAKMRKKLDNYFNFNYEEYQKSKNKHLDRKELDKIKDPIIKQFLKGMISAGYSNTWEVWVDTEDFAKIRNKYDMNDISEISEWIKGSVTNEHDPLDEVPEHVMSELKKLF